MAANAPSSAVAVTSTVYRWVVDDVVARIKPEVVQEGLDEKVLDDLRTRWEAKLKEKGLIEDEAAPPAAVQLFQQQAGGAAGLAQHFAQRGALPAHPLQAAMRPPGMLFQQPGAGHPSAAALALANLAAQLQQAQQQAAAAAPPPAAAGIKREQPDAGFDPRGPSSGYIPQRDGPADDGDEDGGEGEDEDAAGADPAAAAPVDDDEDPLSSDSDEDEEEDDEEMEHFVCCQFEKVTRAKSKWKVRLQDGVFHINGKDYLFKKAQGEFDFS